MRDGPEIEVEITEEMVWAGAEVLADYDHEYDALDTTVRRVLEACFAVRPSIPRVIAEPHLPFEG